MSVRLTRTTSAGIAGTRSLQKSHTQPLPTGSKLTQCSGIDPDSGRGRPFDPEKRRYGARDGIPVTVPWQGVARQRHEVSVWKQRGHLACACQSHRPVVFAVQDRGRHTNHGQFVAHAVFAGLVKAEGIRRGADHVRQLSVLGDGAARIWVIATAKFPGATQIVTLFHAREHLHDLARKLEFMLVDRKDEWLAARLEDLGFATSRASARPPALTPSKASRKTS
jgi:hypothetical protein